MSEADTQERRPLRVCYFGTYRASYSRNQIMLAGLRANGVQVDECHETLWRGIDDRVEQASGGWLRPRFWLRVAGAYWRLWRKHARGDDYDVMMLGYPGQFDAYLGRLLSWARRKPMALDLYMSLYLIAEERGLVARSPVSGRIIKLLERIGLRLTDLLITDTEAYLGYHCQTYGLKPDKFRLVPAGADDRIFYPRPALAPPGDHFRVTYYGTFIPNHGVPTMIRAAALLKDRSDLRFDLYGDGPEREMAQALAAELGLDKVVFHGWLDKDKLPEKIARSHLCLGVFGTTKQSLMTIQNKIWECMAMGRPVLTGDAPTIRQAIVDREEIYLVPRDDPAQLAAGLAALMDDPQLRRKIAGGGLARFQQNSIMANGRRLKEALLALLPPGAARYQ